MKRILMIAVLGVAAGLGAGWLAFGPSDTSNAETERKILYYRDPMNPEITSPTPKKASDGMDFVPVYDESSARSGERKIAYYQDPMHPWYTSEKMGKAPDCGMDLVPVYEGEGDTEGIKINPLTIQNIGVKTATVERRKLTKEIRAVGTVTFDETKVYSVNTKIKGWVEKLFVDYTGKVVQKGEPLMQIYSPELVSTQEEYLQAIRYRTRLKGSSIDEARRGADELVESSRRRLLYWDITESDIADLEKRGSPKKTMTLYSPADGIVMDKMVYEGQQVMSGMELYKIADLSTVWILADIYQYELPWVKTGQKADVALSYLPGKEFHGTITYIYPTMNMKSKTATVRVAVRNTSTYDLKPEMFGSVTISSPVALDAVAIPDQAIIRSGERNIAVIALGGGYFEPRDIRLGLMANGYVQVLDGIREGETIVISAQFLIDSESNLKAAIGSMMGHSTEDMSGPMEKTNAEGDEDQQVMPSSSGHESHTKESSMKPMTKGAGQASNKQAAKPAEMVIDPVCGMTIEPDAEKSYVYQGKTYYFCSMDDMEKFKKNPETYVPGDVQPQVKSDVSMMVVDPVCGMTIEPDKDQSYAYNGKTYYFCSQDDMEKFKKNPAKYAESDKQ